MTLEKFVFDMPTETQTEEFGQKVAKALQKSTSIAAAEGLNFRLDGNLGAGKTTLVRSILRAMGFNGRVKSPTFTLLETYPLDEFTVNHFDFYRFEDPEEFEDAGFRDSFGPGKVCFTEWTGKAEPCVPSADVVIKIDVKGDGRTAEVVCASEKGEAVFRCLNGI